MSFIGLLFIFFGALGQLLINHSRVVSLIMVLASVLFAFLFRKRKHIWKWFLVSAILNVSGLVYTGWYFFVIPAVWNTFFGIVLLVFGRKAWNIEVFHERERNRRRGTETERSGEITAPEKRTARRKRTVFRFLSSAGKGFVFIFAALMILMTFVPEVPMGFLRRHMYHTDNVTAAVQKESTQPNGAIRIKDVCYDTEYPNGYLDIIYTPVPGGTAPMTVVYFHGGGFIWGDKESGDPNARSHNSGNNLIGRLTDAGYNVVSMNYALTPEYTFPTAIKQLNHGLRYLKEHAGEWGLNMDSVVFAGFSAGANLEGVLANIQTNPGCAAAIGEEPVLTEQELKGVIFEGCLADYHRFADTDDYLYDYLFYTMGRLYFRANDLVHNRRAGICNIMDHLSENYPPSFISDGNRGTFFRQASELHAKLTELGVYTELNYYTPEEAGDLWHGFEEEDTFWSEQTMQKIILFLRRVSASA